MCGSGLPVVAAAIAERPGGALNPRDPKVLILKPCCIGDVLLASPLVDAVIELWPGATVVWAAEGASGVVAEHVPGVSRCLDAAGCVPGAFSLRGLLRLGAAIRGERFDIALVPDRSRVLALLPWAARIPVRAGLDSGGRGRTHTVRVPVAIGRHEIGQERAGADVSGRAWDPAADLAPDRRREGEIYLDIARALGAKPGPAVPRYELRDAERREAEELLPLSNGPRVALHPGGGVNAGMTLREKRWPAERFAHLAERLIRERGAQVVVLGAASDRDAVRSLLDEVSPDLRPPVKNPDPHIVDLSERVDLALSAAILGGCDLFIGNDTGLAHLAVAVGTPVVEIFGPTDPLRYGPPAGMGVAVAPPGHVAVDRLTDARGSRAVDAVSEEAVWAAVEGLLGA